MRLPTAAPKQSPCCCLRDAFLEFISDPGDQRVPMFLAGSPGEPPFPGPEEPGFLIGFSTRTQKGQRQTGKVAAAAEQLEKGGGWIPHSKQRKVGAGINHLEKRNRERWAVSTPGCTCSVCSLIRVLLVLLQRRENVRVWVQRFQLLLFFCFFF